MTVYQASKKNEQKEKLGSERKREKERKKEKCKTKYLETEKTNLTAYKASTL